MAMVVFDIDDLDKRFERLEKSVENMFGRLGLSKFELTSNDDELLTVEQASKMLNISISTLHTYKKTGAIPFHRIGRRVYFKKSEILESLKKIN